MIPATLNDKPLVVDILSESFDTNKSVNYVIKQDSKRAKRIKALMEYSFDNCYKFGQIWLNEDKSACALIMGPKSFSFKALLWDIKFAVNAAGSLSVALKASDKESKVKKHHPKHPFMHLWFIGVKKEDQGKGLGSNLIQEIEAENNGKQPIYLETSTERNLPFYQRLGFEIYHELDSPFKFYMMRKTHKN